MKNINKWLIKHYTSKNGNSNINKNPFFDYIERKILGKLGLISENQQLSEYIIKRLSKSRQEIIEELGDKSTPIYSESGIKSIKKFYDYNKKAGIYILKSLKHSDRIYIGSTVNLYKRIYDHYRNSFLGISRHPKLYSYIKKYGWSNMEIQIIALLPVHEKEYPNSTLNIVAKEILYLLTKYELMISEQFFIDKYKPSLNVYSLVNYGGLPNKELWYRL